MKRIIAFSLFGILLICFIRKCVLSLSQNEFLRKRRAYIIETITQDPEIFLSKTGVSADGLKFDLFKFNNSRHLTYFYYDKNNICDTIKEIFDRKQVKKQVDYLNRVYFNVNDNLWLNSDKTVRVVTTVDSAHFIETLTNF